MCGFRNVVRKRFWNSIYVEERYLKVYYTDYFEDI